MREISCRSPRHDVQKSCRSTDFLHLLCLGDMATETMPGDQRMLPQALLDHRFKFKFGDLDQTLNVIKVAKTLAELIRDVAHG